MRGSAYSIADGNVATPTRHLLLVEDNPGDADLTCERLDEAPANAFRVTRVASLAEAVNVLSRATVDAVILDLNLPDSAGAETVRRAKLFIASAPIIAISGQVDDELRDRARDEGAEVLFDKDESDSRLFWRSVMQIVDRPRAQQRQFQVLLDATPDAILLVGKSGKVLYVNQAAVDLFGRGREDLLNEPLGFSVLDAAPTEVEIPRADGMRTCEMRVVRMDWNDEPAHVATIRDITERRQAEELHARSQELTLENRRIETANRMKNQFLANMSHELRTPLNAIIGFSQMLDEGMVDPSSPKFKIFVGHILSSGRHLLQMINDILDLSKVEAGKLSFAPETVDLLPLTQHVAASLTEASAKKRADIEIDCDPSLADIEIDPGRYKQVLYNYLSNALKFCNDAGAVKVKIAAEGESHFRLSVFDSGIGIAAEDIPKLFTEFQQLEAGSAKRHQGTGLGLALTRRLVEAQGGSVGVRSELGQGSEFFAILPCRGHDSSRGE
jgi:signal transduction histidine kinase